MKSLWLYLLLGGVVGCQRRPLDEDGPSNTARVSVEVDWTMAEIAPQNATLLVYDDAGQLVRQLRVENRARQAVFTLDLAVGSYTIVAFNELVNQIEYVGIRGIDRLSTLEAYATPAPRTIYSFAQMGRQVNEPGVLASAMQRIEVEPSMVGGTASRTAAVWNLSPDRKTAVSNIEIAVKGLNNARMPAVAQLRNMASSYFFATDRNSLDPVSSQCTIDNRTYLPGSATDGVIRTQISTFGVPGEWHHIADTPEARFYIDVAFMLADDARTVVESEQDITDLIEILVDEKLSVTVNVSLVAPPLPQVKPATGPPSGFVPDLVDWSTVVVPLN